MYKMLTVEDRIRVPPVKFSMNLGEAVKDSLEEKWEGMIEKKFGVILAVVSVGEIGEGKIFPGDGAIYYPATFKLLVYYPENHEIVKGNIIDVTEFGVFVRLGPIDGMIHVSQIMDDFVSYDAKNLYFVGRDSKRIMKENDDVRARVVSVSIGKDYKIGLTTRQAGLGVLSWLEKAKQEAEKTVEKGKKEAPKKPGGKKGKSGKK